MADKAKASLKKHDTGRLTPSINELFAEHKQWRRTTGDTFSLNPARNKRELYYRSMSNLLLFERYQAPRELGSALLSG